MTILHLEVCARCKKGVPDEFPGVIYNGRMVVINDVDSHGLTAGEIVVVDSSSQRDRAGLNGQVLADMLDTGYPRVVRKFVVEGLRRMGYWDNGRYCRTCPNRKDDE